MTQSISQHDLILISDSGKFYLVKMRADPGGIHNEPVGTVVPLETTFEAVPEQLRAFGVELADLPDNVMGGGASCFLLNLQRLSGAAPIPPLTHKPTHGKKKKKTKTRAKVRTGK